MRPRRAPADRRRRAVPGRSRGPRAASRAGRRPHPAARGRGPGRGRGPPPARRPDHRRPLRRRRRPAGRPGRLPPALRGHGRRRRPRLGGRPRLHERHRPGRRPHHRPPGALPSGGRAEDRRVRPAGYSVRGSRGPRADGPRRRGLRAGRPGGEPAGAAERTGAAGGVPGAPGDRAGGGSGGHRRAEPPFVPGQGGVPGIERRGGHAGAPGSSGGAPDAGGSPGAGRPGSAGRGGGPAASGPVTAGPGGPGTAHHGGNARGAAPGAFGADAVPGGFADAHETTEAGAYGAGGPDPGAGFGRGVPGGAAGTRGAAGGDGVTHAGHHGVGALGGAYSGTAGQGAVPGAVPPGPGPQDTDASQGARRRGGLGAWARRLAGGRGEQPAAAPAAHEAPRTGAAGVPRVPDAWPDPAALLLTALGPGPRLWERGPGHPEALAVRLGTADRSAPDGSGVLPAVPVTASLREVGGLGLAGPRPRLSGLARAVLAQLAALHSPDLLEVVLISADRSRPVEERTAEWSWLGWLPHVRPGHGQDCRLLLAYDREQAAARTEELLRRVDDYAASGRSTAQPAPPRTPAGPAAGAVPATGTDGRGLTAGADTAAGAGGPAPSAVALPAAPAGSAPVGAHAGPPAGRRPTWARDGAGLEGPGGFPGPYTVVVVDGDPGGTSLQEALGRLATAGPRAGIHVLCLAETEPTSPVSPVARAYEAACAVTPTFRHCGAVALLSGDVASALHLMRIAPTGPVGPGALAAVDAVSAVWAERFARALAPLRADGPADEGHARVAVPLPQSARLLDELGLARATPASLMARWADSADDTGSPGGRARAVLGAGPHGPLTADLVADGPHLLVEGPAGSGRTELLRTVVASLAAAERPDRLGLVLIDGRDGVGTGAGRGEGLRVCTDIPHVTTHLLANDPVRMREFAQSLSAELKRRAELLGRTGFAEWHAARAVPGRVVAQRTPAGRPSGAPDAEATPTATLRLRPAAARQRTEVPPPLPRLVVVVDDLDALVSPALGSPGRPAAGSVLRALEAVAREGERLGVHLVATAQAGGRTAETEPARRAALRVTLDAPKSGPDEPAPGRGRLAHADGRVTGFQGGRVTGRIPRTATQRPTVVPLEWQRMGDPPARRPVRELGNGPTDLALLASAVERAAREVSAAQVPSLL
ncbi:FtsK/SpoIIIE domain-containing protein [Streptomyces sp. TG1A-8]|uniref:FtsK/SpoIIIE domain-containing protein n=1 Tax=Streptomyces sp. TG1A-8 TaxID=3051385 RepID=UPI00265BFB9A|nr:FtsK/SpoIIIE domain-containing protein [Streptomyces sp. TG1A-8]MDO0927463.1 FtsK/SpoIIIE domain-containing protein [Streptomyces sp. TG1A-8]